MKKEEMKEIELLMTYTRPNGYNGDTIKALMYYDYNTGRIYESTKWGSVDFFGNSFPSLDAAIDRLRMSMDKRDYFRNVTMLKDDLNLI